MALRTGVIKFFSAVCYPTFPTISGPFCGGVGEIILSMEESRTCMYIEKELMQTVMENRNRVERKSQLGESEWNKALVLEIMR